MGILGQATVASPVQHHQVHIANDVIWITGELETLGSPHNYINQDGLDFLRVTTPHIAPWLFTGLPSSHSPLLIVVRERVQFLMFPQEQSMESFRRPPRAETLILHLPLAVVRGDVPFLSEAKLHNFLDFWKGIFFPVMDAEIHFLAEGPVELPTQAPLFYVNRNALQAYVEG